MISGRFLFYVSFDKVQTSTIYTKEIPERLTHFLDFEGTENV